MADAMKKPHEIMDFESWLTSLEGSRSEAERQLLRRAFNVANQAHANQKRASGEPYIQHCLAVAQMLAELDFQFHLSLARATRNDLFEMLLTPLMEQLHDYYLVVWAGYGERPLEIVFEQHERLLDAVEARDSEAAREAMALHLAYSREVMKRQLDSSDGGAEHD
jgi:GTP pyrophosphokinase